jgi:hypothetical protein
MPADLAEAAVVVAATVDIWMGSVALDITVDTGTVNVAIVGVVLLGTTDCGCN